MATINLLQIGCTAQEVIDTINELVAAHNAGENAAVTSYNDLTDKPTLNGVTVQGAMTTSSALIRIADTADFSTYNSSWATKTYVDTADTATVTAAEAAAQAVLANKLDKDLGNITATTNVGDDAYIPVVNSDGTVNKITAANMASYTEVRSVTQRTVLSDVVKSQLKILPLTGTQDGTNTTFNCADGYTLGTSCLYYNGQLLTAGSDYVEATAYTITMLTHIPTASDVLTFLAVPMS